MKMKELEGKTLKVLKGSVHRILCYDVKTLHRYSIEPLKDGEELRTNEIGKGTIRAVIARAGQLRSDGNVFTPVALKEFAESVIPPIPFVFDGKKDLRGTISRIDFRDGELVATISIEKEGVQANVTRK